MADVIVAWRTFENLTTIIGNMIILEWEIYLLIWKIIIKIRYQNKPLILS